MARTTRAAACVVVEEVADVVGRHPHRTARRRSAGRRRRCGPGRRRRSARPRCRAAAATIARLGPVAATGEVATEGLAGRVEQQVARGADPAADDERARVERGREVGDADAEPLADLGEQLAAGWSPSRAASVTIGPVRSSGRPSTRSSRSVRHRAAGRHQRAGLAHQGVARGVLLPAAACCRTRSAARRAPPACGRTRPRCRSGPRMTSPVDDDARRRCRCRG